MNPFLEGYNEDRRELGLPEVSSMAELVKMFDELYPETVKEPVQEQKDMIRDVSAFNARLEKKMGEI